MSAKKPSTKPSTKKSVPKKNPATAKESVQERFLKINTEREINVKLPVEGQDEPVNIVLRKWSLRQRFKLGVLLSRLLTSIAKVMGVPGLTDGNASEVVQNVALIEEVLALHTDNIYELLRETLKPNFDGDIKETEDFIDSLDPAVAFELVMLVANHNRTDEDAKKKYESLMEQAVQASPSR